MSGPSAAEKILHASSVLVGTEAVLLLGPSGSGKSTLALELMAFGGLLVADDRTLVFRRGDRLIASCPAALKGRIEARGVGILCAEPAIDAPLKLAVDLARKSPSRLPPRQVFTACELEIDLICGHGMTNLAPVILQLMKGGFAP